jgi:hypothetical protein
MSRGQRLQKNRRNVEVPRDAPIDPWRLGGMGLNGTHVDESTNVCGHPYSLQIRRYVSSLGMRSLATISRYSRTLTPTSQAARQPEVRRASDRAPSSPRTPPAWLRSEPS